MAEFKLKPSEVVTTLNPLDVPSRLNEFRLLKDGWLEGEGRAPHSEGLDWFATQFEQRYPADLPLPHLYPTPDGGVRAEWSGGSNVIVLEIDLGHHSASWLWFDRDSDAEHERELELDSPEGWGWLADAISRLVRSEPVTL